MIQSLGWVEKGISSEGYQTTVVAFHHCCSVMRRMMTLVQVKRLPQVRTWVIWGCKHGRT